METPGEQGLELVDTVSVPQKGFVRKQNLDITEYSEPVVFDLADPPVYAVDQQGVAYEGQSSSYIAAVGPAVLTQESRSVLNPKLKEVVEEEQVGYDGSYACSSEGSEGQYDSDMGDLRPNYNEEMHDVEDMEMEEGNRQREEEVQEQHEEETEDEESEEELEDEEQVHYEGDTEVEELFELEDDDPIVPEEEEKIYVPAKKKQKLQVRRGPTTRSHSSVLEEVQPDWKPSSDEEDDSLLKDSEDDGFEPLAFVLPQKRKSRAKKRPARVWYNEDLEQPHQQLKLHMCFKDQHQFRDALLSLHITQCRDFKYHRNSDQRIIVHCKNEHCKFCIVAAVIKGENTFVIKKMRIQHTCPSSTETSRVSAKWLAKQYEPLFRSDVSTSIHTLIDACMEKYGVDVPKAMAYRAKNLAVEAVLGDHRKQYPRLRDYAQTVMDTNPGSRVIVTTVTPKATEKIPHPGPRFHAMFYCINGAREGFLQGCRPFIGIDGCFIKLTTGAQILAATGRDGNNNIYPLAFGIVGQEDKANWCWFLHQLKICLGGEVGQYGPYTIMSDRQKGLLYAVNRVFPNSHQRFCLRHIYANFQNAGFRGEDLKKCMDNASYAYNEHKFNKAMDDLKAESVEAWQWLSAIPKKTWARHAFDTNSKTDLVVNNLSEVFNKYILDHRKKPIRTMCDGIKDKQMVRWHRNRESGREARWEITPHYSEKLEIEKERARYCKPIQAGVNLWQVTSGEQTHAVNLEVETCGCRKWDLSGIPCNHAISAINKAKRFPEDFVSKFFKKPYYLAAYEPMIYPVPGEHDWTKTPGPDIEPPAFKVKKGRRKEKRIKGKFEVPKPKSTSRMGTITCSNCGLQGHKYTNCLKQLKPELALRKNKHVISCTNN
ncbi:uncharacterized protein [Triticum aestivum]|uniref:uncharacterized protein n=1 Tax=Triticum aestivum TaxID=4565 RepID=UPI001D020A60|nr:uncharacterized protein LOC123186385 [Triticum aestivum]